jgi:hypothetical protein
MTCRASFVGLLALVGLLVGGQPVAADPPASVSSYYLARADARLCPSPRCGGLWVRLVNRKLTTCGDGIARSECYVAAVYLTRLRLADAAAIRVARLVTEGRALMRGKLAREGIEGLMLDTFDASEVWKSSSSRNATSGVFRKLTDNGVRCVTAPCFSTHASTLNTAGEVDVSDIDLGQTGAAESERRAALGLIGGSGLIAAGKVVRKPNAGPAGAGRTFVASQFYVRVKR